VAFQVDPVLLAGCTLGALVQAPLVLHVRPWRGTTQGNTGQQCQGYYDSDGENENLHGY